MYRKFHNHRTMIDGVMFDSKKEAAYYCDLRIRKKAKDIIDFGVHPKLVLLEGFKDREGKKIREVTYEPDFVVYENNKTTYIDVKGGKATQTDVWRLKWKLAKHRFEPQGYYFEVVE